MGSGDPRDLLDPGSGWRGGGRGVVGLAVSCDGVDTSRAWGVKRTDDDHESRDAESIKNHKLLNINVMSDLWERLSTRLADEPEKGAMGVTNLESIGGTGADGDGRRVSRGRRGIRIRNEPPRG